MLQFGARISSIDISKQKLCIAMSHYVYNKYSSKKKKKTIQKCLLSHERWDLE